MPQARTSERAALRFNRQAGGVALTGRRLTPKISRLWWAWKSPLWGLKMDKKRLDYYKKKLIARREDLLRTIARTEEEGRAADDDPTVDLADKAANSYTKEFLFGMTNSDRSMLAMIDEALKRIKTSEYGLCANCQEELLPKRLEAVPWAKHCVTCQEKKEQGLL